MFRDIACGCSVEPGEAVLIYVYNLCFEQNQRERNEKMAFQSGMIRCILHINCIIAMNQKYVQ